MKTHKLDTIRREKAQAAVELALTIPIVLVLILGMIEGGWLLFVYTSLTAAGREAARYGAGVGNISSTGPILYNDCVGIKEAALRVGQFAGIKAGDIHIYKNTAITANEYCLGNPPSTAIFVQDDRIVVKIDIIYTPISPLVRLPSFPLHSQNAHTIVLEANVEAVPCDLSKYIVGNQKITGKTDEIPITNNSVATQIIKVSIDWNTTKNGSLQSISSDSGSTGLTGLPSLGPSYSSSAAMNFPAGLSKLTLTFSEHPNIDVIIRLTLAGESQCVFGQ